MVDPARCTTPPKISSPTKPIGGTATNTLDYKNNNNDNNDPSLSSFSSSCTEDDNNSSTTIHLSETMLSTLLSMLPLAHLILPLLPPLRLTTLPRIIKCTHLVGKEVPQSNAAEMDVHAYQKIRPHHCNQTSFHSLIRLDEIKKQKYFFCSYVTCYKHSNKKKVFNSLSIDQTCHIN